MKKTSNGNTEHRAELPFRRISLVVVVVFVASLLGCGKLASSTDPEVFMINYAHESGGVMYNGTFALIGGKVMGSWTTDRGGKKEMRRVSLSEEAFRGIWDSVNTIDDFKKGAVNDPNRLLNLKTHHVVGIAFRRGGQEGMQTHLIPVEGASPAFKDWLAKLGYQGN